MDVYLLPFGDGRSIFYSDGRGDGPTAAGRDRPPAPRRGIARWFRRRYRAWQFSLRRSQEGLGGAVRRVLDWLKQFIAADEILLRTLRTSATIVIHHPETMTEAEARAIWDLYLASRRRRHLTWLLIDGLLCPLLIVVLTLIPGPNVLAYWFVYRAACHALALLGVYRARSEGVPTSFRPEPALNTPLTAADPAEVAEVERRCGLNGLGEYVGRAAEREGPAVGSGR